MAQLVRPRSVPVAGSIPVQGNIFKNLFLKGMNSQVQQTRFLRFFLELVICSNGLFEFLECASQTSKHADHLENLQILIQRSGGA